MNLDNILQNIEQVKNEELENSQRKANEMSVESEQDPSQVMLDDYTKQYFEDVRAIRKKTSRGASGKVLIFTRLLVLGDKKKRIDGLKKAYTRVKMDIEQYKDSRPELVEPLKRRYMEEKFLPVVEAIIMQTSPEDLYNSASSLELLDRYVLLPYNTSGRGYTKQYIKTAYLDRGILSNNEKSSGELVDGIRKIRSYSSSADTRVAYLLAKKLKDKVDKGKLIATDNDYELLSRIVSYYE